MTTQCDKNEFNLSHSFSVSVSRSQVPINKRFENDANVVVTNYYLQATSYHLGAL